VSAPVSVRQRVLVNVVVDHIETLSLSSSRSRARMERAGRFLVQLSLPLLLAAAVLQWRIRLHNVGELMAGMSVLAGLLFGLLFLVWTAGIQLRDNERWSASARVVQLVDDLRANVTYACLVSLLLVGTLAGSCAHSRAAGGSVRPRPGPWMVRRAGVVGRAPWPRDA
jgi:hypothetical protein